MHCHRLIEIKVPLFFFFAELIAEEVDTLQNIGLLDKARAQDMIPRPILV